MDKIRAKMPPSQRAKQFAPFDAVVGLRKALREKEKIRVQRKELFDDAIDEINNTLKNLNIGDAVTVVYYSSVEQAYLTATGQVTSIDAKTKILTLSALDIKFEDIYKIKGY
ncbi:MAG: YolD-like family protein [Clostridia bacterium]|nr:YolD-like family protein [Clostridia bacterium]